MAYLVRLKFSSFKIKKRFLRMWNKGALASLAEYGDDSSDDEVPGARVSTKRVHKDDDDDFSKKRFERLPVPNFTLNNPEEVIDDPALHDGRIRTFQHERGNWATYVYIPFELNEGLQRLISIIAEVAKSNDLKFIENLHLSLTRTVILKYHWIDPFISTVKTKLSHFTKFVVMLNNLEVYCNEEKTRTFIGLQIKTGHDSLLKLVQCLDGCLGEFKLPQFYEHPSFHISIAWCLGDCTEKIRQCLPQLNTHLEELMNEYPQDYWYTYVEQIMCKTGNKLFQFQLK